MLDGEDPDVTREDAQDQDTVAINLGPGVTRGVGGGVTRGVGLGVDVTSGVDVTRGVGGIDNVIELVPIEVMYESDNMAFPVASFKIHPPISNNIGA